MTGIHSSDYQKFYKYLEKDKNKILKHLVAEIDDASIFFRTDKKNYTNFIGALVTMYNQKPESIADRWPSNTNDFAKITVNLNPVTYEKNTDSPYFQVYTSKHNNGTYKESTGEIVINDVYTAHTFSQGAYSSVDTDEPITTVSPLTPIILVPNGDKLPLIATALGENNLGGQMYIVPAIFLKYNADKIRNDYIEKGVITTLDVATIALSGGTALAAKVRWVRRAWALAEVAGAFGNIAVNTGTINPNSDLGKAVNAYNLGMGIIGVKNVAQGGYKFVAALPENTKNLLQENKSIRDLLTAKYMKWKTLTTNLDNISTDGKQLITEQEKVWKSLGMTDNLDNVALYIDNLFKGARQRIIAKYGKEAEDLIYIKFKKDGGAAAEVIDHYGQIGLEALKKVNNIDDVAKELIKNKTVYRAVNETTYNFDKLKTQGIIEASPEQYPTYVSLDKYSSADIIKSKLQLPKKPTWVAEFDGNQIMGDVRLPKGKYLTAEYREILCKSHPNLGKGGGSQFITNSPIKIKRLINLETGEIINFL